MSPELELGARLRDNHQRVFLACTGAGAGLQQRLWAPPGASEWLVGGLFPYATDETDLFLGFRPDSYCSERTALELAMSAFMRAAAPAIGSPVGIGITASVASLRAHKGDHRIFAAAITVDRAI